MALSVTYTTVNGMLAHEVRGGVDTVYVPDTLGSTARTITPSTGLSYSAIYWPYGEVRTASGKNFSPWGFVGLLGYFTDFAGQLYVRARHYRPSLGRWQTMDPLWPKERAYEYSGSNPSSYVDPTGTMHMGMVAIALFVPCVSSTAENPCDPKNPKFGKLHSGCVAYFCAMKTAADMVNALRKMLAKAAEPLRKWIEELIKRLLKGPKNNLTPDDCCALIHSGNIPNNPKYALIKLIDWICQGAKQHKEFGPRLCVSLAGENTNSCYNCCNRLYPYDEDRLMNTWCINYCNMHFEGDNVGDRPY